MTKRNESNAAAQRAFVLEALREAGGSMSLNTYRSVLEAYTRKTGLKAYPQHTIGTLILDGDAACSQGAVCMGSN